MTAAAAVPLHWHKQFHLTCAGQGTDNLIALALQDGTL